MTYVHIFGFLLRINSIPTYYYYSNIKFSTILFSSAYYTINKSMYSIKTNTVRVRCKLIKKFEVYTSEKVKKTMLVKQFELFNAKFNLKENVYSRMSGKKNRKPTQFLSTYQHGKSGHMAKLMENFLSCCE